MNRTNQSLSDRNSMKRIISFIEQSLQENPPMSKPYIKRGKIALKRYQDALEMIEAELVKTGGRMTENQKLEMENVNV